MFTDEGQLGIFPEPWSTIGTPLEVMWETQGSFPVATGILGFLSIFKGSQASSPFEALNSACLLRYQRDVEPPVEMRQTTRAFSGSPQDWKGNSDVSQVEAGDPGSLSSCHSVIGFPINFQQESGIVTF